MQVYRPFVSNLRKIYMCGSLKQKWTLSKEKFIYENCVDYQFATHLVFHEFVCLTCILILMFNKHLLSTFYLCSFFLIFGNFSDYACTSNFLKFQKTLNEPIQLKHSFKVNGLSPIRVLLCLFKLPASENVLEH